VRRHRPVLDLEDPAGNYGSDHCRDQREGNVADARHRPGEMLFATEHQLVPVLTQLVSSAMRKPPGKICAPALVPHIRHAAR